MKNPFFFLTAFFCATFLAAQSPIYLQYSPDCMNRLEYRYRGQADGSSIFSYSIRQGENQLYVLDMGAEGNKVVEKLPPPTITCQGLDLNDGIVKAVNNGIQKIYIVRQVASGWLVSPVSEALQVVRAGSVYIFRGQNLKFSMDTSALTYGQNIANEGSNAYIFFNGRSFYQEDCHPVYSLHREPDAVCLKKTDFDFVPGVGMISERSGDTNEEALKNEYRLVAVNGLEVEKFMTADCRGQKVVDQPVEMVFNQPAVETPTTYNYGVVPPPPAHQPQTIGQPDKEVAVAKQETAPAPTTYGYGNKNFPGPPAMVNCPEQPGEGYHIVQPGETLNGIARAYGVKMGSLIAWNNLKDPDIISTCQKIYLTVPPGGIKPKLDEATGKVAIATKPGKKSTSKWKKDKKKATRPATYSTENPVAAAKPKTGVQPQTELWKNSSDPSVTAFSPTRVAPVAVPMEPKTQVQPQIQPQGYAAPQPQQYTYQPPTMVARADIRVPSEYKGIIHNVQTGESLYSISKIYGFTVDRFAKMNGLPENYVLQPGMQLMTSDCTCDVSGKPVAPQTYSNTSWKNVPAENTTTTKTLAEIQNLESSTSKSGVFQETEVRPQTYGFSKPQTSAAPNDNFKASGAGNFKAHFVQQNETLGDIARQYNVSTEKIATVNGLELTETLIIGMRLMIPQ